MGTCGSVTWLEEHEERASCVRSEYERSPIVETASRKKEASAYDWLEASQLVSRRIHPNLKK